MTDAPNRAEPKAESRLQHKSQGPNGIWHDMKPGCLDEKGRPLPGEVREVPPKAEEEMTNRDEPKRWTLYGQDPEFPWTGMAPHLCLISGPMFSGGEQIEVVEAAVLEAAEREISYLKEKLNATFERAEDAEREVFARDAVLEIKDAEIARLTRELEEAKTDKANLAESMANVERDNAKLRAVVEAAKALLRNYGNRHSDDVVSKRMRDALAALEEKHG